jgi:CrcB protein
VSGAFLLGWILARAETSPSGGLWLRWFGGIGFCGAFTTFSSVNLEMVEMANHGHWRIAVAYLLASLLCGIMAAWAGARYGIEKREAQQ